MQSIIVNTIETIESNSLIIFLTNDPNGRRDLTLKIKVPRSFSLRMNHQKLLSTCVEWSQMLLYSREQRKNQNIKGDISLDNTHTHWLFKKSFNHSSCTNKYFQQVVLK